MSCANGSMRVSSAYDFAGDQPTATLNLPPHRRQGWWQAGRWDVKRLEVDRPLPGRGQDTDASPTQVGQFGDILTWHEIHTRDGRQFRRQEHEGILTIQDRLDDGGATNFGEIPQGPEGTGGDRVPCPPSLALAVSHLVVPGVTAERLAGVCPGPAAPPLCRSRDHHGGDGQRRAQTAMDPRQESKVVCGPRRAPIAHDQHAAGSGP
jgi:hypothetical protein